MAVFFRGDGWRAGVVVFAASVALLACEAGEDEDDGEFERPTEPTTLLAPKPGDVRFGMSQDERFYGVRITDNRHAKAKSIYSIELKDISADERIAVRGELTLSVCGRQDIAGSTNDSNSSPCTRKELRKSGPHAYKAEFHAKLILADSPNATEGRAISRWRSETCSGRKHHCSKWIAEGVASDLKASGRKYVNLIASADAGGANARSFDVMEVEQGRGGLYVTRIGKGSTAYFRDATDSIATRGELALTKETSDGATLNPRIVIRKKVTGLTQGDIIDVDVDTQVRVRHQNPACDAYMVGEILVGPNPNARRRGGKTYAIGEKNGYNCTDHSADGCGFKKSVAGVVRKGLPEVLYVSYVLEGHRTCVARGDTFEVKRAFLDVRVRR